MSSMLCDLAIQRGTLHNVSVLLVPSPFPQPTACVGSVRVGLSEGRCGR
jgi:hypothetical protein